MKKRVFSLLLSVILLAACAPMAAAQRSLRNPDDALVLPEISKKSFFHPESRQAGARLFGSIFEQIFLGTADPQDIMRLMERAPLVKEGDELPPLADIPMGDIPGYMLSQGLRGMYIVLRETQWPDEYQLAAIYSTRAGETLLVDAGIGYNAKTGLFHSWGGNAGYGTNGIAGLGYEYEASKQLLRTNSIDSWHRRVGYSVIYDALSPAAGIFLDTKRFPFAYDGKDYMVQIWRGIYGWFSNGGEIGFYEKPAGRPVFWDCSDTELDMSMQIQLGGEELFDYGTQHTWWLGGFRLNSWANLAAPRRLGMTGAIAFEDPAMLAAFLAAFEANRDEGLTGQADGLVFSFEWKPAR